MEPGEDFPQQMAGLYYVTPGGNIKSEVPKTVPASTILTFRLIYRKNGEFIHGRLFNNPLIRSQHALRISCEPPFGFDTETSAAGRYLHIIPHTFLEPNQGYALDIEGSIYTGGLHIGNLTISGRRAGSFKQRFSFQATSPTSIDTDLRDSGDWVTAFEIARFTVPIPTVMPSLNQIGFDYMDWIVGLVHISELSESGVRKVIFWAVGGTRNENGLLVADPQTEFVLPLLGSYHRKAFILSNQNFTMSITGIPIPFNLFQIRGQFSEDMVVGESAAGYAEPEVLSIPTFGPLLVLAGLANNW